MIATSSNVALLECFLGETLEASADPDENQRRLHRNYDKGKLAHLRIALPMFGGDQH